MWRRRPQPPLLEGASLARAVLRSGAGARVRPGAPGVPGVLGVRSCQGTRHPALEPGALPGRRGSPRAAPGTSGGSQRCGLRPALFGSPRPRTAPTARSPFPTEIGNCDQKNCQSMSQGCGDPKVQAVLELPGLRWLRPCPPIFTQRWSLVTCSPESHSSCLFSHGPSYRCSDTRLPIPLCINALSCFPWFKSHLYC